MINISARGFELKQGTKDGIEKELKRVEKMLPSTAGFDITIAKGVSGYKVDITVKDTGSFIRGEAVADKIERGIDYAVDDLKRKLRKLKTSLVDKKRKSGIDILAGAIGSLANEPFEDDDKPSTDIRRQKFIALQMMTDDEAVVQMEMLGHSFFVYLGEDGNTHVIYARKSGYGMIVCE